ncbi:hypothetical protein N7455_010761 [Penicillium solitum]|uniref:uncharacterized protein n=1 Tax=Penicillium solitum TaxID=60172 RepID=UPI0017C0691D|nr:hypothetical protein HAV15_000296 [Penicillium sp. str. \
MSSFKVETAQEPSKSPSSKGEMVSDSSTAEEAGGISTDSYVENPSSEFDWTFERAIQTIKSHGPEMAEKHMTLTFQNISVLGDPSQL